MNVAVLLLVWATLMTSTARCEEETEDELQERLVSELKFTDWELAESYEKITKARKEVLFNTRLLNDEIHLIESYGKYLKEQSRFFIKTPEQHIPYEHTRNYTLLTKPGDSLLNETEFHELVTFAKESDHLSRNLRITHPDDPEEMIGKQTFLDLLATSRNFSQLQTLWSSWQNDVSKYSDRFGDVLSLVSKAASRNELYDAKSYWETLVEYDDGYQKAETLWNDIEPLYRRLHEFVLTRINNYYETNFTNIPVYLTGSNFGEDWSNLADILIPHQQMYKDAEFEFQIKSMEDVYKLAEACGVKMGFGTLSHNFWSESNFEREICPPTILTYTFSKYSEVLTCNNLTWDTYINAHHAVLEAGMKSLDIQSLPRRELRYSFYDEAIVSLGAIIAVQNLPTYGFTPESDYVYLENATEHASAAKLLIALRLLPKLAYYVAADRWRLEELQNLSDNMTTSWWAMRRKIQGVEGVSGAETDFLDDTYIVSNKPYLAKFLGGVLQFELLSYSQLAPFTHNDDLAERMGEQIDYKAAVHDAPAKSPVDVITFNYAITDVKAEHLTEFFEPLKDYLDVAPLLPYATIPRERLAKIEVPEEVTTDSITTTAAITTLKPNELEVPIVQNDQGGSPNKRTNTNGDVETPGAVTPATGHSAGMYVLITIGACFFIFVAVVVFKKVVNMKRPRTNNRRFEA